ncbi:MAG TPA: PAS domain-containing protein [Stellaceae bacterium]|jgi:hypothetical protein|nr:PAS domain-containing protein [Stellaceae bacterium]
MSNPAPACAAAFPDCIETPCLRQLYLYWEARRGNREFPARRDLDPLDFRFALGHIVLIDVLYTPLRFRFRVHGSELSLRAGYDMTGKMAEELPDPKNRARLIERCRGLVERPRPLRVADQWPLGKRLFSYEAVWLPLGEAGRPVTMLMAGMVYRDGRTTGPQEWQPESAA